MSPWLGMASESQGRGLARGSQRALHQQLRSQSCTAEVCPGSHSDECLQSAVSHCLQNGSGKNAGFYELQLV